MIVTLHNGEKHIDLHVNVPPFEGETLEVPAWGAEHFIVKNVHHILGHSQGQTVHIELAPHRKPMPEVSSRPVGD